MSTLDNVLKTAPRAKREGSTERNQASSSEADELSGLHVVYGVLVEELVHWLLTPARQGDVCNVFTCPTHTAHPISAPDLLLCDVREEFKIAADRVILERFLGRGAFGSVFSGSAYLPTNGKNNFLLNLAKISVGVKICSPMNPKQNDIRLSDWQPQINAAESEEGEEEEEEKKEGVCDGGAAAAPSDSQRGPSDLDVALALYKQEHRRWAFQPVESCYIAYQELRSELAVLLRIVTDSSATVDFNDRPSSFLSRTPTISGTLQRSARLRRSARTRPRLFAVDLLTHNPRMSHHLLTCLGVVCPRPLCLLLPLAPCGSLSDWLNEMHKLYEEAGGSFFPIHTITLTCIVNQV
uniref:Protein kinase domain-containing protein n=1 Tax=Mesocestoides corti TaxID=53468 RepID=A0A5K3F0D0_MESCO